MYAPSLEVLSDNERSCVHCGKHGGLTYQKSEKAQTIGGISFSAEAPCWHCNFCGCNTPLEVKA